MSTEFGEVQGRDRLLVSMIAEQLGLAGSYVPRTYIEQIQLEKLVNDIMALPDDLKTRLSIDEDLALTSPKDALSRTLTDGVATGKKYDKSMARSFSTHRDKNLPKLTRLSVDTRRFDGRNPESPSGLGNQGVFTQLSEQIATLNERMDEFVSRIEELNSRFTTRKVSTSQQNLALQTEACNGSTQLLVHGLGNGSLLPTSSSSSQLAKESAMIEEVTAIVRGQRQLMHQLDNLNNFLRDSMGERQQQEQTARSTISSFELIGVPLAISLAIAGIGVVLFKGLSFWK